MKHPLLLGLGALASLTLLSALSAAPVGAFSDHGDIGSPAISGSTSYDGPVQTYRMTGSGTNLWGSNDQCQFAWNRLSGDFILRARIEFVGMGTEAHRKLGWMVRSSLDADSAYADGCVHGDGLTSLQFRRTKGATTEEKRLTVRGGDVLQLERRGNTITFSAARYGDVFESTELKNVDLGADVYAGLFLCAHNGKVKEEAVFRDVRIIRPAKADFRPYHDYIGSTLEVLNVFTGKLDELHHSAEPFEAPNWLLDGRTLLYNISGSGPNKGLLRLHDLVTGEIKPFDSGVAIHNNNDHVFSFDNKMLGVSNHAPESQGQSAIFTLAGTGGTATRITPNFPSYLHGWSPDAKWLVYTGGRNGKFDIYKIPSTGGDEVRLTDTPGLSDGPEFSPDGAYIYFNSTRTGRMQLWRMKPDGSQPEQLTNDEFNNWFPHLSPDGKWIAFISFGAHVRADDHPYYEHIYLRLMPANGGPARVVAYIYGGQGTMNVPSWSPDGTRVAFVSNSDTW
ncbi:MAG TPA: biopolymer transporter TolR [Candidatus Didemnitutus sp.]|nr:biopolymer transporter TolR [Candidatus Didemnitutus sp.]